MLASSRDARGATSASGTAAAVVRDSLRVFASLCCLLAIRAWSWQDLNFGSDPGHARSATLYFYI